MVNVLNALNGTSQVAQMVNFMLKKLREEEKSRHRKR